MPVKRMAVGTSYSAGAVDKRHQHRALAPVPASLGYLKRRDEAGGALKVLVHL
jgi:hypothetical protein